MYVCICHGITDKKIEASIEAGATTMKQLSTELGVASQCGKCARVTKKILNDKLYELAENAVKVA
ncbi:bacterioferritin-associated ferredoxin [Aliamphritea hakodatensis]|uniref:bacterioferritin-associated ferredoxin n=1 Tax=Aliamphritea hakodatensis TaxID=2895352 RepID=UPI0022FD75D6|nr:bacterioferritin-associated ferredoxin [Aliamphritea hakodatensis]